MTVDSLAAVINKSLHSLFDCEEILCTIHPVSPILQNDNNNYYIIIYNILYIYIYIIYIIIISLSKLTQHNQTEHLTSTTTRFPDITLPHPPISDPWQSLFSILTLSL